MGELLWGYEEPLLVGATMVLPPEEVKVKVKVMVVFMMMMRMSTMMTMMMMMTVQVRVEGHFGLLAGRNMSSEGRLSNLIIIIIIIITITIIIIITNTNIIIIITTIVDNIINTISEGRLLKTLYTSVL